MNHWETMGEKLSLDGFESYEIFVDIVSAGGKAGLPRESWDPFSKYAE